MPNIWSGEAKHYKDSLLSVWGRSITEFILRIYSTDTSQCVQSFGRRTFTLWGTDLNTFPPLRADVWILNWPAGWKPAVLKQQTNRAERLSGGSYTLHFLSDAFASRPAAADRWGLIGAWPPRRRAGELLTKWGVTAGLSETSHQTSRPDLGPRWHMGVKEVRKPSRGGGVPSCPLRSHETPSCHNRHLPALTLNTHQGGGGLHPSSFKQRDGKEEGWRGKREGNLFFLLLWCLRNAGIWPPPLSSGASEARLQTC